MCNHIDLHVDRSDPDNLIVSVSTEHCGTPIVLQYSDKIANPMINMLVDNIIRDGKKLLAQLN